MSWKEEGLSLTYWGYIAAGIQANLRPYILKKPFSITQDEKKIIDRGKDLLEVIIKCIDDAAIEPSRNHFLTLSSQCPSTIDPLSVFDLIYEFLSEGGFRLPDDLRGLKTKFEGYVRILDLLKNEQPLPKNEIPIAKEISLFFSKLKNKALLTNYNRSFSTVY